MQDIATDDGVLDESRPTAPDAYHGTNVAGVISGQCGQMLYIAADNLISKRHRVSAVLYATLHQPCSSTAG
jgi:hypothetical protein